MVSKLGYTPDIESLMRGLNYNSDIIETVAQFVIRITYIPVSERNEIINAILWQFDKLEDSNLSREFNKIFIEHNIL